MSGSAPLDFTIAATSLSASSLPRTQRNSREVFRQAKRRGTSNSLACSGYDSN
jgi:hypothetical protein